MSACAYRSLEPVLVHRIAELRERRQRDGAAIDTARRVTARRIGRAAFGVTGIVGGALAFLLAMLGFVCDSSMQAVTWRVSTSLLLGAWPAAVLFGWLVRRVAGALLSLEPSIAMVGDPATDLATLQARDPLREARASALRWERSSVALPLSAIALLAPLTIHWGVWSLLSPAGHEPRNLEDFGAWIGASGVLVGHAHLVLLGSAVRWAGKLRSTATCALQANLGHTWGWALGFAVITACIPGLALLAVPPILVAVTGILFVPVMFIAAARRIQAERFLLEEI